MRPTKLSSKVFIDLPPILAHYVEADRNMWVEGNPKRGRLSVLNRSGTFQDLEAQAVERRHLITLIGEERARALKYRSGFEQGRRDAQHHLKEYGGNTRLALQAALVHAQVQGKFIAESICFEFDMDGKTLYRELNLTSSAEAYIHRMSVSDESGCKCWNTAGYLSGHVSEILGTRVATLEITCMGNGADACQFISRLEHEFGDEAQWISDAFSMPTMEEELARRDELLEASQKAARSAQASLGGMNRRLRSDLAIDTLVAESRVMQLLSKRIQLLMNNDAPVVLTGETGVGKVTIARAIHFGSTRKRKPFVEVDCKGIPEKLLEQELLGIEQGAIPGALKKLKGAFAKANGGTLYLSEVTSLSLDLQAQLLYLMEAGKYRPVGATRATNTDVRIIAATHTDPEKASKKGILREELYYALNIGRADVPPLRKRDADILRLAENFVQDFAQRHNRPNVIMTPEFKKSLLNSAWPGNVRQLKQVLEHAVIMSIDGTLKPGDLPDEILANRWLRQPSALTEEVIMATLNKTHNNRSQAAELLGVGRTTLWRTMKRLGLD